MLRNVHGPYSAASFMNGAGAPNDDLPEERPDPHGRAGQHGHIGMIYARNADGSDQIIEAKGEAYGVDIWTRTYRGGSASTEGCGGSDGR